MWLPGCWVWQNGRYAWRPGFWATAQPDWNWIPAHYVYAPRGYVFVDGYWDYSVARRGVLFAPVYFSAGVYGRPGFSYSPRTVIDPGVFANHLFLRPRYQHYYFGDYYAANYQDAGFYPSYSYNSGRYGYDPIYAHQRWQHRQDGQWDRRAAADFQNRRDNEDARPPRVWTNQGIVVGGGGVASAVLNIVGASLDQAAQNRDNAWRFQAVDQAERQRLARQSQEVQRFREERQRLENDTAADLAESRTQRIAPAKVRLPGSPIAAKPVDELDKNHAPPKMYEVPNPDPKVAANPRVARLPEQPQQHTVNRLPLDTVQPQPQPQSERPASQPRPQLKADRPAPQRAAGPPSAVPDQGKHEEKGKDK
jgi:hypothetical protein